MTQTVSFINMKGGVGKTTLAANVAYGLAYFHDQDVLLVDADPQFNASTYLMTDDEYLAHLKDKKRGTILDIFVPRRAGRVDTVSGAANTSSKSRLALKAFTHPVFEDTGRLDLIPSTLALMEIETSKRGTENRLRNFLQQKAQGYDYVIIDCPPTISVFTQSAILASDKYVVPLKPDPLSTIGLPLLERWLAEYTEDAGTSIEPIGIIFSMLRNPTPRKMSEIMQSLRKSRKDGVFDSCLHMSTIVSDSVEAHEPVFRYKKSSKYAEQIEAITAEFLDRTGDT